MEKKYISKYLIVGLTVLVVLLASVTGYLILMNLRLQDQLDRGPWENYEAQEVSSGSDGDVESNQGSNTQTDSGGDSEMVVEVNQEIDLDSYENSEFLADNAEYELWVVDYTEPTDLDKVGDALFVSKEGSHKGVYIENGIDVFGTVSISEVYDDRYIVIDSGTGSMRGGDIVDLADRKVVKSLCVFGDIEYSDDLLFYSNCDTFDNRPWGAGQASSIAVVNLLTGEEKVLLKSDELSHYSILGLEDGVLSYEKMYVESEDDWGGVGEYDTEDGALEVDSVEF